MDHVEFEVVEGGVGEDDDARVAATADLSAWRESEREFHWPDEPTERVRELLKRLIAHLGLRGSVDVVEHEEEIFADVNGPELGLLIGKHGSTLDAIQFICSQAAFRGAADRKRVVVDAGGIPRAAGGHVAAAGGSRCGRCAALRAPGGARLDGRARSAAWCTPT